MSPAARAVRAAVRGLPGAVTAFACAVAFYAAAFNAAFRDPAFATAALRLSVAFGLVAWGLIAVLTSSAEPEVEAAEPGGPAVWVAFAYTVACYAAAVVPGGAATPTPAPTGTPNGGHPYRPAPDLPKAPEAAPCGCVACSICRVDPAWRVLLGLAELLFPLLPGAGILFVYLRGRGLSRSDASLLAVTAFLLGAAILYTATATVRVTGWRRR